MSRLKRQMREDKALRDTAHSLVTADVAHVRNILSAGNLGKRIAGRIGDGASDVMHKASDTAGNNRGILAAVVGAVALWFARKPIMELLGNEAVNESDSSSDADSQTQLAEESLSEVPRDDDAAQEEQASVTVPPA